MVPHFVLCFSSQELLPLDLDYSWKGPGASAHDMVIVQNGVSAMIDHTSGGWSLSGTPWTGRSELRDDRFVRTKMPDGMVELSAPNNNNKNAARPAEQDSDFILNLPALP